jgi:uncharacterized protein (TIGR01777 family)
MIKTILIAGGTGMVGSNLVKTLLQQGYKVHILSRKKHTEFPTTVWDPENNYIDLESLPQADVIVNLAGAGIADKRWTQKRKESIIDSRVNSNKLIQRILDHQKMPLDCYISASAIGIYGDHEDEWLDENSIISDHGFLTKSVKLWESSVNAIKRIGTRIIIFRFGMVLSKNGGVLDKLVTPTSFFIAPYFGSGKQYYAWIHIDDLCKMIIRGIEDIQLSGIYNAVSPTPVTDLTMMKSILNVKHRLALLIPIPEFFLKLILGEMASIVLISSRVFPKRISDAGFEFQYEKIEPALQDLLT